MDNTNKNFSNKNFLTLLPEEQWIEGHVDKLDIKEIHFVKHVPYNYNMVIELDWNPTIEQNDQTHARAVFTKDKRLYISTEGYDCIYANKNSTISFAGARNCYVVDGLELLNVSNVNNMCGMFFEVGRNAQRLKVSGMENWDTAMVESMSMMFNRVGEEAFKWNIGNLSKWNTQNVKHMSFMFNEAGRNAIAFDIGNLDQWNVSNVEDMCAMFMNAGFAAQTWSVGDISNWDVSNVKKMDLMFWSAGCYSKNFTIGDIRKWDVSSVVNMNEMLDYMGNETNWNIDLSSWDVSNVKMHHSFHSNGKIVMPNFKK